MGSRLAASQLSFLRKLATSGPTATSWLPRNCTAFCTSTYDVGSATNIKWHETTVTQEQREQLLNQKGCVLWFTGLSGSGKSTLANALDHALLARGKLSSVLDGDNMRHGLNKDLGFSAVHREENIRRVGERASVSACRLVGLLGLVYIPRPMVLASPKLKPYRQGLSSPGWPASPFDARLSALRLEVVLKGLELQSTDSLSFNMQWTGAGEVARLFADAGLICIVSFISPYKRDRDRSRSLLPAGRFVEVYMKIPLSVCEARDPKGLYKQARAGKVKGFTGIDDPYEEPTDAEVVLEVAKEDGVLAPPEKMAQQLLLYLEDKGLLEGPA